MTTIPSQDYSLKRPITCHVKFTTTFKDEIIRACSMHETGKRNSYNISVGKP